MLKPCSECGNLCSDKAISCPKCGNPINSIPFMQTNLKSTNMTHKREHMKLPNGFGSIKKLSGNRRKPYAAYPSLRFDDYDDDGNPPKLKALGYFETWYDAYDCLQRYNSNDSGITFDEVYQQWYKEKFFNPLKPISDGTRRNYDWGYTLLGDILKRPLKGIRRSEMQTLVNSCYQKSPSSPDIVIKIFNQVFNYGIQEGYITTNYASFVDKPRFESEKGEPLTEKEIDLLWKHSDDKNVQITLIYLYSGMRLTELKITKIDLESKIFIGGIKTKAGKDRVIPIHPLIYDFVRNFNQEEYDPKKFGQTRFKNVKKLCGFAEKTNGKIHTCHDLRHTFSWLWDKYVVPADTVSKHLVMGHSLTKLDVEDNTYGHRTIEQLRNAIEKIKYEKPLV